MTEPTLSSIAHRVRAAIHFDDLQWENKYDRIAAYGQSKLANLMFTYEQQRRLAATTAPTIAVAAYPGVAKTELGRNMPTTLRMVHSLFDLIVSQPPTLGALPTLRAATDPATLGGNYYGPDGRLGLTGRPVVVKSSPPSHDTDVQRRWWAVSEELTGVVYPI